MSQYDNPPPPYPGTGNSARPGKGAPPVYDDASTQPLLGVAGRSGIYDQPGPGEIPDDFLVSGACALQFHSLFMQGYIVRSNGSRMRIADQERFRPQSVHHSL